jgi:hypothetical protein
MKIRFIGEGVSDVGGERCTGIVPVLTRNVLAAKLGRAPAMEHDTAPLPRFHGKGYAAKAQVAITEAHRQGLDGVAIAVDRDGRRGTERLKLLRQGRDAATAKAAMPAAVGVAIETIEAWLLADEPAIGRALRFEKPPPCGPDPESLDGKPSTDDHPKVRLAHHLAMDADRARANQARLEAIAEEADVAEIERRCVKGFKPFAEEVRDRLAPIFAPKSGQQRG